MSKKLIKSLSYAGAATLASVSVQAHAQEVVEPVTPTTTTAAVTTPTLDQQIQNQTTVVDQAKETTSNVQADTAIAQTEAQTAADAQKAAQTATDQANANLTTAEQNAAQATPENIANVENQITTENTNLTNVKNTQTQTQKDLISAETAVTDANTDLSNAQQKEATSKQTVDTAQTNVNNAQASLDGTGAATVIATRDAAQNAVNTAQTNVNDKTAAVTNATKDVADKTAALTAAQTSDKALDSQIAEAKTAETAANNLLTSAKSTASNATTTNNTAKQAVADTNAQITKLTNQIPKDQTMVATTEWINALKTSADYSLPQSERDAALATLKRINQQQRDANNYINDPAGSEVINDLQNLTEAQRIEISTFANDLINQLRAQMGTSPMVLTKTALDFATQTGDGYKADNFSPYSGHDVRAINTAAANVGLTSAPGVNYYENKVSLEIENDLGFIAYLSQEYDWKQVPYTPLSDYSAYNLTMNDIKKIVYDGVKGLMFNGVEWVHAKSIVDASSLYGGPKTIYGAIDFSQYGTTQNIHFLAYSSDDIANANLVNNTPIASPYANIEDNIANLNTQLSQQKAAQTQTQLALDKANADLAAKQTTYDQAHAKYTSLLAQPHQTAQAQTELNKANDVLRNANNELTAAKDQLATTKTNLLTAQAAVNNLNADIKTKEALLQDAKDKLLAAQTAYAESQENTKAKETSLQEAKDKVSAINNKISTIASEITAIENKIADLEKHLSDLQNAPALLVKAKQLVIDAEDSLETANLELQLAEERLAEKQAELQAAKDKQASEQAILDKLLETKALQEEVAHQQELLEKQTEIKNQGLVPVPVYNDQGKIIDYKAQTQATNTNKVTNLTYKQTSNKSAEQNKLNKYAPVNKYQASLPSTGDSSAVFAILGLSILGLAGMVKKRNS